MVPAGTGGSHYPCARRDLGSADRWTDDPLYWLHARGYAPPARLCRPTPFAALACRTDVHPAIAVRIHHQRDWHPPRLWRVPHGNHLATPNSVHRASTELRPGQYCALPPTLLRL